MGGAWVELKAKITKKNHHPDEAPSGKGEEELWGGGGGEDTHSQVRKGEGQFLPCREMNELAREPRSLYPAFQRKTEERKDMERKKRKAA